MDASHREWILSFLSQGRGFADATPVLGPADWNVGFANLIGGTATQGVYLSQEVDSRRAFHSRPGHFGFELFRSDKCSRRFQIFPFKQKCDVIDVSGAAENSTTALAVFMPPIEVGIESRFPSHVIGDFVVDKNVDHDFSGTPFKLKVLLIWEKCKGAGHRAEDWKPLGLRAGPVAPINFESRAKASHVHNWNPNRANDCVAAGAQIYAVREAVVHQQVRLGLLHGSAKHVG